MQVLIEFLLVGAITNLKSAFCSYWTDDSNGTAIGVFMSR